MHRRQWQQHPTPNTHHPQRTSSLARRRVLLQFSSCLTLTMTINQAITRCKCNALNIFPNLHPTYFLTDSLGTTWNSNRNRKREKHQEQHQEQKGQKTLDGKWKSPSGTLQFIWKLNLRQICADSWLRFLSFQLPQKFSLWQLHELDYIAGSRYVYRDSSHVFGLRQATLHSFLSSYVNFGSSWFVGGPENFTQNRRQQQLPRKT